MSYEITEKLLIQRGIPRKMCDATLTSLSDSYYRQQLLAYASRVFDTCDLDLSLILSGKLGSGKAHDMSALAKLAFSLSRTFQMLSAEEMSSIYRKDGDAMRDVCSPRVLRTVDVLFILDIGYELDRFKSFSSQFMNLYISRKRQGKITVISTDMTVEGLQERYGEGFSTEGDAGYIYLEVGQDSKRTQTCAEEYSVNGKETPLECI